MALSCYDEALAIPTEKAQKIAVRTQQIIAEEIGVTDTIDPMAGSYYVEWLTNELERRAVEEMEKIEKMGGAVEAIDSGYYHKAILDEAYKWEQDGQRGRARGRRREQVPRRRGARPGVLPGRPDDGRAPAREARAAARRARLGAAEQALAACAPRPRARTT